MNTTTRAVAAAIALLGAGLAQAQSSVTVYGVIDQYLNYMHSSSGATIKSLEDGALTRSRFGVRGQEDLGGGYVAKFNLEGGFSTDTGTTADTGRFWDRQAWVGMSTPVGEFRVGRQNGPIFAGGRYVDYTYRDLGSIVNNFGAPSRYDNDISYLSPRMGGFQVDLHVALPETAVGNRPLIIQGSLDYQIDGSHVGYMGLHARPPANAAIDKEVVYDQVYGMWNYGKGNVYLTFVRTNNNTASAGLNNAGSIISNVGGTSNGGTGSFNAGNNPDLNDFYNIYQVSADYQAMSQLRIGALWGRIQDKSGRDRGASGGSVGAYYDLSKRTTLLALVETMRNDANGGFRHGGSAALKTNFTNPNDVNGRTINGIQFGVVHRF